MQKSKDSVKTPQTIINTIKRKFFNFEPFYDPVPFVLQFDKSKHKNGLTTEWKSPAFCNPPYSKASFFVEKAWKEYKKGVKSVLLVKNDVLSTQKFTKVKDDCRLLFFNHRIKFEGYNGGARFTSVMILFGYGNAGTFDVFEY